MPYVGGENMPGRGIDVIDRVTPAALDTGPSAGRRNIEAYLQSRGLPLTGENSRRALEANARQPGTIPNIVNRPLSDAGADMGAGAPRDRNTGTGPNVGGRGSAAREIGSGAQPMRTTSGPNAPSDSAASAPKPVLPQTPPQAGPRATLAPTQQPNDPLGMFSGPSAGGIGAAILASILGGLRSGSQFVGNTPPGPSGRMMDAIVDPRLGGGQPPPMLAGPRAQLAAPTPSVTPMAPPPSDPLQAALGRAVPPDVAPPPAQATLPQRSSAPLQLDPPPAPPPIRMPNTASGPTINMAPPGSSPEYAKMLFEMMRRAGRAMPRTGFRVP